MGEGGREECAANNQACEGEEDEKKGARRARSLGVTGDLHTNRPRV